MFKYIMLIALSFLAGALIGWVARDAVEHRVFHNHHFDTNFDPGNF